MSTSREQSEQRLGSTVDGKWRLDALIGYSPVAATYRAIHRNGRQVALKIIHPSHGAYAPLAERFLQEAHLANRVDHPGVERVFDDGRTDEGCVFLVMELLEGESLELLRVRAGGQIALSKARRIFDGFLEALDAVHSARVVHRSLKPGNVFLTTDLRVVLTDFGRARLADPDLAAPTIDGPLIGTPAYMPPEQARGERAELDARSDVWSAGAILFTTLSGRRVHEAETADARLALAVSRRAPPARSVMPDLDGPVAAVIDRALAFDKRHRWPSAVELRRAYWIATGRDEADLPPLKRAGRRSFASIPAEAAPTPTPTTASAPAPPSPEATPPATAIPIPIEIPIPIPIEIPIPIAPVVASSVETPGPGARPRTPTRRLGPWLAILLAVVLAGVAATAAYLRLRHR